VSLSLLLLLLLPTTTPTDIRPNTDDGPRAALLLRPAGQAEQLAWPVVPCAQPSGQPVQATEDATMDMLTYASILAFTTTMPHLSEMCSFHDFGLIRT
jgi:hypothetical protein